MLLPLIVVLLLVAAGGYYGYVYYTSRVPPVNELAALRGFIEQIPAGLKLSEDYKDANGDLVADPPSDPTKLLKVDEISFSVVAVEDPEKARETWKDFMAALEKATGKKVTYMTELHDTHAQLDALREGKLHVTAFSTGLVPKAVNTAGFVPLFAPADAEGKFSYEMEILVPASSPIKSPAELKGKTVAFTALESNSGAKAPMVILKEKFGLLPARDYTYVLTGDHFRSLKELGSSKRDAACVANDLLARAIGAGDVKPDQFRSIYKSASFPPLCLGVAYNLPPDLTEKVKQTFADFKFEGTSLEKQYKPQGKVKFAPVNYKLDWAYVREIDDSLTRLLDTK
jgi:phosphonate transport system substrate-binding protein